MPFDFINLTDMPELRANCTDHLLLLYVLHKLLTIAVFCREHHLYLYYVAKRSKLRINPVNSQTDNWGPPNFHMVESNYLVLFPYRARDSTVRSLIFSQENPAPVPEQKRRGFIGGGNDGPIGGGCPAGR
jgi:hypothetical protein